jgi:hypothetical protein
MRIQISLQWNETTKPFVYTGFAALAMILSIMACNLMKLGGEFESDIQERLLDEYGIPTEEISYSDGQLTIVHNLSWIQDEGSLFANWLILMDTAVQEMPSAREVILELEYLGEPYMSLQANARQVRQAATGKLDLETFFSDLTYVDLRAPDQIIYQECALRGIDLENVDIAEDAVYIEYFPPFFTQQDELLTDWIDIADLALFAVPESETIMIHAGFIGQPDAEVEIRGESLRSYREGSISSAEFLSTITVARLEKP